MSKKLWISAPLVSVGLLGCGAMLEPRVGTLACTAGICKVEVTVVNCVVTVSPLTLCVPLPRGAKNIHWDIVGNEYTFAPNGIVITDPDGEFDADELSNAGKKFKWHNKHTKEGYYKYSVNVMKNGGTPTACPTYDPLIANQ